MVYNYHFKRNNKELLKEQCLEYLGGKVCKMCKATYLPIRSYDFHHCMGDKDDNVATLINQNSTFTDEIKKELDKCMVLCSNCHRSLHCGCIDTETLLSLYQ